MVVLVCCHSVWCLVVRRSGTPGLTSGAAEAFPLLPSLGIAQDVDDQRGKLAGVEPGQLLPTLPGEEEESESTAQYGTVLRSTAGPGRLQPLVGCCSQPITRQEGKHDVT